MKKLHRKEFVNLPAVSLYRDDLDEIVLLLSADRAVRISDGEFEFDSLDELAKKRGATPSTLELDTDFGAVGLKIRRLKFSFLWGSESPSYLQIRELLRKRTTFLAKVFVWKAWLPSAVLLYVLDLAGPTLGVNQSGGVVVRALSIAAVVGLLASQLVQGGVGSSANLTLRHETSTFWSRNGDKILLAMVSAILGICAKAVYDFLVAYARAH